MYTCVCTSYDLIMRWIIWSFIRSKYTHSNKYCCSEQSQNYKIIPRIFHRYLQLFLWNLFSDLCGIHTMATKLNDISICKGAFICTISFKLILMLILWVRKPQSSSTKSKCPVQAEKLGRIHRDQTPSFFSLYHATSQESYIHCFLVYFTCLVSHT